MCSLSNCSFSNFAFSNFAFSNVAFSNCTCSFSEDQATGETDLNRRPADPEQVLQFVEDFLSSLPHHEFTEGEASLREALFRFVCGWDKPLPPRLTDAALDPDVKAAKKALLPEGVGLSVWINARMAEELELMKDPTGQYAVGLPGQLGASKVDARAHMPRKIRTQLIK